MLKSAVISIGKEIINGSIKDTNSFFISQYFSTLGFDNRYIIAVDDKKDDIAYFIRFLLSKVDVIVSTGGLGPTFDDITLESIAYALGKNLYLDKNALGFINDFYTNLYRQGKIDAPGLNDKRKKMAYLIEGCEPLRNEVGAAWGCYVKIDNKHIFSLPGIPKEMKPMFENWVVPILRNLSNRVILSLVFDFDVNDESVLGELIDKVMRKYDVYIKSLPEGFDNKKMRVRFTATGLSESEAKSSILKAVSYLKSLLEAYKTKHN